MSTETTTCGTGRAPRRWLPEVRSGSASRLHRRPGGLPPTCARPHDRAQAVSLQPALSITPGPMLKRGEPHASPNHAASCMTPGPMLKRGEPHASPNHAASWRPRPHEPLAAHGTKESRIGRITRHQIQQPGGLERARSAMRPWEASMPWGIVGRSHREQGLLPPFSSRLGGRWARSERRNCSRRHSPSANGTHAGSSLRRGGRGGRVLGRACSQSGFPLCG